MSITWQHANWIIKKSASTPPCWLFHQYESTKKQCSFRCLFSSASEEIWREFRVFVLDNFAKERTSWIKRNILTLEENVYQGFTEIGHTLICHYKLEALGLWEKKQGMGMCEVGMWYANSKLKWIWNAWEPREALGIPRAFQGLGLHCSSSLGPRAILGSLDC